VRKSNVNNTSMYVKFDRTADGCVDNKGSCGQFVGYMAKEDKKDFGHAQEWWFDQNGKDQTATYVQERIDEDWQGLGKNETKFTTGSIAITEQEWLATGSTEEERLKNFKAWTAEKFTREFAGNFNKHKLPTEEDWQAKGATPRERVDCYAKEVADEVVSRFATQFMFNKPTAVEVAKICSRDNPAEAFKAWMYDKLADRVKKTVWVFDKKKEGEAEWQGLNKEARLKMLESEVLTSFKDKFEAKFEEYKAVLGFAIVDPDMFKEEYKAFAALLRKDFKLPPKEGAPIIITPDNVKIYYKLEHNRYYKGGDKEVLQGKAKAGDVKPGFNKHIHFIIATKTADKQNRINPQTKNKREFNRVDLFHKVEHSFDEHFGYQRRYEESFAARLGARLVAATQANRVSPLALGKEAFKDSPAEREIEDEDLQKIKGKRR